MRYKTIMVQLDVDVRAAQRLQFACELALRFDAGLIGFAAAEPRLIDPSDVDGATSVDLVAIQTEEIEARLEEREKEFRTMTAGVTRASWRGEIGHPTKLLAIHARAADLIVTGAGTPDLMGNSHRLVKHGALILAAGRPVLLASGSGKTVKGERIVIAWKDTREARRSVSDAMPFLVRAQDVLVTTIEENDSISGNESVADVASYLIEHGVKARSQVIGVGHADAAFALNEVAREIGADMIVSGGYGHSRLRELIFGGVTRSLLRESSLNRLISN
ncbi:UspA domain-containing protein [Mesorhizobium alhagi CCNWXJ12-2]|uniref:UspA domain-containing protein n=2 Tax=Allomesorhizobium alhagi TaxID=475067 RepID=H0I1G2_9HYPH|nr:UspA domain-containing protein [Mesorhizobium alhagi CCNWXJ12-2]